MKPLRRLLAVSLMVLSLSVISFAGDVETPGKPAPPPPPPGESMLTVPLNRLVIALLGRLF